MSHNFELFEVISDDTHIGLGQAMAIKFAEHGCTKLFIVDIAEKGLHATQQLIQQVSKSAQVVLYIGDISNEESVKGMVSACVESYGRLDFAMNNAGIALGGIKTADMPLEMFEKTCNINEKGASEFFSYINAVISGEGSKV